MHVFATGGTGTLGTPVVAELLAHGHTVLALARSDASAAALEAAGAETLRGSLEDLDSLREGARRTDGVVHLAFGRDYSSPESLARGVAEETAALQALGAEMQGTDRPIVAASGTPWVAGRAAVETDPPPTDGVVGERGRAVLALLGLDGVRASAVRMPRTAHANGEGGFAGLLTEAARRRVVPAGVGVRTGGHVLACGRRGGGGRTRHRRGGGPSVGPAGAVGRRGDLRSVRCDFRPRSAGAQRDHPSDAGLGTHASRTARGSREPHALTVSRPASRSSHSASTAVSVRDVARLTTT